MFFMAQTAFAFEETLILFDSSLSMFGTINGKSKHKIAIEQTQRVLNTLPSSYRVGLRIIGIVMDEEMGNYLKNPNQLCRATKLLVPIGTDNINDIKNSLSTLMPLGTTPLEYSIDRAVKYDFLPSAELKHIILVTDGVDECKGNPCKYIKELMQTRKDIKIDVIAIGVSNEELSQLKCISEASFGEIKNVSTPQEMNEAYNLFLTPKPKKSDNENYQKNPRNMDIDKNRNKRSGYDENKPNKRNMPSLQKDNNFYYHDGINYTNYLLEFN